MHGFCKAFCILLATLLLTAPVLAQAAQHCGAEGDWRSNLVPDNWPPPQAKRSFLGQYKQVRTVPVYRACIKHDRCYETRGSTQKKCDKRFYKNMKDECERVYPEVWQLPLLKACHAAAYGYYQAVAKHGRQAFKAAQANAGCGGKKAEKASGKPGAKAAKAVPGDRRRQGRAKGVTGKTKEIKWNEWGRAQGVDGLSAMRGKLYIWKGRAGQIWQSPVDKCSWSLAAKAPKAAAFTAGGGRFYLWDQGDLMIRSTSTGKIKWTDFDKAGRVENLLLTGGKVLYLQSGSGRLMGSSPWKPVWEQAGVITGPVYLAGDAGRIYKLKCDDGMLSVSWLRGMKWRDMGRSSIKGPLAAHRGRLFIWDRASNRILWSKPR